MEYMLQELVGASIHGDIRLLLYEQGLVWVADLYSAGPIHPVHECQPVGHGTNHQQDQSTNSGPMV